MKARRNWTKAGRLAAAAVATLALAGMAPTTATAAQARQGVPGYVCSVLLTEGLPLAEGRDCHPVNGTPALGPVFGQFVITDFQGQAVYCEMVRPFSGLANAPGRIDGRLCRPVEGLGGFPLG